MDSSGMMPLMLYGSSPITQLKLLAQLGDFQEVAFGDYHTLVLRGDGTVHALGYNRWGQLGLGGTEAYACEPKKIPRLRDIVYIAAGATHSMAIDSKGALFMWGSNRYGKCASYGKGKPSPPVVEFPHKVASLAPVKSVVGGMGHTVILLRNGKVICFGKNTEGQCGLDPAIGTTVTQRTPLKDVGTTGAKIACGRHHTAIISKHGKLLMFGAGDEGQLGRALTSDIQYSHIPTVVDLETNVLSVACGAKHTMALTTEGAVYAFGANNMGQLGLAESPPMNIVHTPSQVDIPVDLSRRQAHTQGIATPERCGGCPSLPTKTANPQTKCGGGGHALVQEKGNVHTDERTLSPGETHSEVVMRLSQLSPSMARRGKQPPPIITTAPTPPPPVAHATSISCGLHHSVVVTRHGGVYACGNRQALAVHADTAIIDAKKRAGACTRARAHAQACAQGADTCCGDWKAYENELKTCCDTPVASHTTGNKGDVASSECGNARKTCGDARDVRGDAEKSSTRQCSNQPAHFTASCNETALTLLCSLGNLSKRSGKDGPEGAVRVAAGGNHVCVYLVA